jgi:Ca2+-binding RTX toxin-like protein
MTELRAFQLYSEGPNSYSVGIKDIDIVTAPGGGTVVYAGSGWGGGITAWSVSGNGGLSLLGHAGYPQGVAPFSSMSMTPITLGGAMHMISVTSGTDTIRSQALRADGVFLGQTETIAISGQTPEHPGAIAATTTGVFVAQGNGGIAAYTISGGGGLNFRGETGGSVVVTDLMTVEMGNTTYVIASHGSDHSVTSYRVDASGGLIRTDSIGAAQGLGMGMPGPMDSVTLDGRTYVLVGSSQSNSISVIEIDGNGNLFARDHVLDTLHSRFGQITSLEIVQYDGTTFVLAGGGDDGISLMVLLPGGRLIHLHSLADTLDKNLNNITAIGAVALQDGLAVYAASETEPGLSLLEVDLTRFGETRIGTGQSEVLQGTARDDILWGRGGNDTLIGGDGADVFVFDSLNVTVQINDFDPTQDQLDLSMLPMFYGTAQLAVVGMPNGVTLTYNSFTLVLIHAAGGQINLADIHIDTSLSHLPTGNTTALPQYTAPALILRGTDFADVLTANAGEDRINGNGGADTLAGNAGNDTIMAGSGNDLADGGSGDDSLNGQDGDDTLIGGEGDDTLMGAYGNDVLHGGPGDDYINGQVGLDTIYGGAGNDTLRGSYFEDTVFGEDGDDVIDGGSRDDVLYGGAGNDLVDGVTGNDMVLGEDGNDTIRGGEGIDTLDGGNGDDLVAGGNHSDLLIGGAGNDTLWGQGGLDTLMGGAGNDVLVGGENSDQFVFTPGGGDDTVNDFELRRDFVVLDDAFWGGGLTPQQVIETYAIDLGADVLLNLPGGDSLLLRNVDSPTDLINSIVII